MAYPKTHNPFADNDEEEEENAHGSNARGFDDDDRGLSDAERRQRQLQVEVTRTAQSAIDSTNRSLGLIYESEKMGGEALKRSERMVDNMEEDLKTSQRHINGIKSVGKPEVKPPPPVQNNSYQSSDKLQECHVWPVKNMKISYQASHPNLRKLDTGGERFIMIFSLGLSRLKGLGLGLQSEIESQDDSLDNLLNKVDKMDLKINNTNQQIKNLK
ncbi:hypothetical protein CRUP_031054 [Coryphaenoides rupestris]|nr:hypothetical protein CRUP_031054 [Coryphaenoides rupestris]